MPSRTTLSDTRILVVNPFRCLAAVAEAQKSLSTGSVAKPRHRTVAVGHGFQETVDASYRRIFEGILRSNVLRPLHRHAC